MAINVRWDNRDKTVVLMEFESEWAFADLESSIQSVDTYIGTVSHTVDVIIDVEGTKIPKDYMSIVKALLAPDAEARANEGRRVVVGASNLIRQGYQLIQKTFSNKLEGREMLFADDVEMARSILRGMR
jgi:hypothetical protein